MKFQRHLLISALLLFVSCFALPASANEIATYDKIVIFGDSLSDNGNLYHTSFGIIPKSPPYYQGRFTNGPTWADTVGAFFHDKHNVTIDNYAVGGETVNFHNPFKGFLPYTFTNSLDSYYLHTLFQDKSHSLFIIWLGANDYLHGAPDYVKAVNEVITTIQQNTESLIAAGGRSFLFINLPNLADVPFATPETRQNLADITIQHNAELQKMADKLKAQHPEIVIHIFDFYSVFKELVGNLDVVNKKYNTHIKNLTDSCWTGGYFMKRAMANSSQEEEIRRTLEADYHQKTALSASTPAKSDIDFGAMAHYIANNPDLMVSYNVSESAKRGGSACAQPDDYAFWDTVHPTAAAHTIVAVQMIDQVHQFYMLAK